MQNNKRFQLTLFVGETQAREMERIRQAFNPEQYRLINSHVTLCREDELEPLEQVLRNLAALDIGSVSLDVGTPQRFSAGKGVLIPAIGPNAGFHNLRAQVLRGIIEQPRNHEPHITLMHPRNATCTDEIFAHIESCTFPRQINFHEVALIEQEMGEKWAVLEVFALGK